MTKPTRVRRFRGTARLAVAALLMGLTMTHSASAVAVEGDAAESRPVGRPIVLVKPAIAKAKTVSTAKTTKPVKTARTAPARKPILARRIEPTRTRALPPAIADANAKLIDDPIEAAPQPKPVMPANVAIVDSTEINAIDSASPPSAFDAASDRATQIVASQQAAPVVTALPAETRFVRPDAPAVEITPLGALMGQILIGIGAAIAFAAAVWMAMLRDSRRLAR